MAPDIGVPLKRHWNWKGGWPEGPTVKLAVAPPRTVALRGWLVIVSATDSLMLDAAIKQTNHSRKQGQKNRNFISPRSNNDPEFGENCQSQDGLKSLEIAIRSGGPIGGY